MTFVKWATVVRWKGTVRDALAGSGVYPYQYSSDNRRFLEIKPGDVLWIITTPRFDARGRPSPSARARPPAVMARLRIERMCCNKDVDEHRVSQGKEPICRDSTLPDCADKGVIPEGVHQASDRWSVLAVGEKDPVKPRPLEVTYPVLYNCFGVLHRLKFETKQGVTDLSKYLEYVSAGHYLTPEQDGAMQPGAKVRTPGPYARFGQYLQTLRKLTPQSAESMDALHERAVQGRRVFFSYKWVDVERIASDRGLARADWIRLLNRELDRSGFSSWLDHHQITTQEDMGGLLEEVLVDAVRQSVLFVVLMTPNYGTGTTLKEWTSARRQLSNLERRDKLVTIVLDCGGDPDRLGLTRHDVQPMPVPPDPRDIVDAIERVVGPGARPNAGAPSPPYAQPVKNIS